MYHLTRNTIPSRSLASRLLAAALTAAAIAGLVSVGGCSHSEQQQQVLTQMSGDLAVSFTVLHWPPHSGDDTAIITIMSNGQPVNDATVVATANMRAPKLDGSPASGRFQGDGQYEAPLRLVATSYDVDVHIERTNRPAVDVTFPLEAWQ